MFLYNPIGKTLFQVHQECGGNLNGYAVFILQDKDDTVGVQVGEDISILSCLKQHKEGIKYVNYIVKFENDFFGETVLRAIDPTLYQITN